MFFMGENPPHMQLGGVLFYVLGFFYDCRLKERSVLGLFEGFEEFPRSNNLDAHIFFNVSKSLVPGDNDLGVQGHSTLNEFVVIGIFLNDTQVRCFGRELNMKTTGEKAHALNAEGKELALLINN
jgi:hypothetical protein